MQGNLEANAASEKVKPIGNCIFLEESFHSFYLLFVESLTVALVFVLISVNGAVAMKAAYWYPKHLLPILLFSSDYLLL